MVPGSGRSTKSEQQRQQNRLLGGVVCVTKIYTRNRDMAFNFINRERYRYYSSSSTAALLLFCCIIWAVQPLRTATYIRIVGTVTTFLVIRCDLYSVPHVSVRGPPFLCFV